MKSKIFFLIILLNSYLVSGQDIFVDQNANGLNTGQSWTDAYQSLDSALQNAQDEDTIWVAKGIYRPNDSDRENSFILNNLHLIGGFSGNEISVDERDYIQNKTILCGDIGQPNDPTDNCYSVVRVTHGYTCLLDGFIIQNGNGDGGYRPHGGGIRFVRSALVRNCVFINNYSINGGAFGFDGIYAYGRFENCKFISNSAEEGGAISLTNGSSSQNLIFSGCLFNNNHATDEGGAVYLWKGNFLGVNCTFVNNSSCLYIDDPYGLHTIKFVNSLFQNNGSDDEFSSMFKFLGDYYIREISYCLFPLTTSIPPSNLSQRDNIFDTPEFLNVLGFDNIPATFDDNYQISSNSPGNNKGTVYNAIGSYITDYDYYGNERVYEDTIDIGAYETNGTSSLDNGLLANGFTVYPNPTNGFFTIDLGKNYSNITVCLRDLEGKLLDKQFYKETNIIYERIYGAKGVYIIWIYEKNRKLASLKILKI